jgi:hypothetical protein
VPYLLQRARKGREKGSIQRLATIRLTKIRKRGTYPFTDLRFATHSHAIISSRLFHSLSFSFRSRYSPYWLSQMPRRCKCTSRAGRYGLAFITRMCYPPYRYISSRFFFHLFFFFFLSGPSIFKRQWKLFIPRGGIGFSPKVFGNFPKFRYVSNNITFHNRRILNPNTVCATKRSWQEPKFRKP